MFFYLSLFFVSCEFCWVRCSLNSITHFAAKFDVVYKARIFFFFLGVIIAICLFLFWKIVSTIVVLPLFLFSLNEMAVKKKKNSMTMNINTMPR